MRAYFDDGLSLDMTMAEARQCSHPGDCLKDVQALIATPKMRRQLKKLDANKIRKELKTCGAWNDEELADDAKNLERIVWIAAGQIIEEHRYRHSGN